MEKCSSFGLPLLTTETVIQHLDASAMGTASETLIPVNYSRMPLVETDEELLLRAQADSDDEARRQCFNQLFARHQRKVALWCLRFTGDREMAADLAQEVFLKVYRSARSFQGQARFSTWLYSVARNHCLNYIKRRSRLLEREETTDVLPTSVEEAPDLLRSLERRNAARFVRKLMNEKLTPTEKRVMTLKYLHELPMETVTRMLGLENKSGAKAYVVSAMRKLRRAMKKAQPDGKASNEWSF